MMEEIRALSRRGMSNATSSSQEREDPEPARSPTISSASPAQAVNLLAPQIPEFGGTDEENVQVWTSRVDKVARVHRASDDVILLAASSKLVKTAKIWYDMQTGDVLESWQRLKQEISKMFDRKISFTAAMQKIEARRWISHKESFDQYAMDKLALIHRLNLSSSDVISLLIGGIQQESLRAAALTLSPQSVDQFLETMRRITVGMDHSEKKSPNQKNGGKFTGNHCKTCGKKGHSQQDCKSSEKICNYCKGSGHWKADCPRLKRKDRAATATTATAPPAKAPQQTHTTTATITEEEDQQKCKDKLKLDGPIINLTSIKNVPCTLKVLIDTGSPASFIALSNLHKFFDITAENLESVDRKFYALPKTPINILGKVKSSIRFENFPDKLFEITLYVVGPE